MDSCSGNSAGQRHPRQRSPRLSAAFTLIEVSIVIAIIAVIAAMSASMAGSMIESARKVNTTNKLNAVEDALMAYRLANNRLPCPTDPSLTDTAANAATFGLETGTPGTCGGGATTSYTVPAPYFGTVVEGAIPVKALNLPDEFQLDGWGRKIAYAVWTPLTAAATGTASPAGFLGYGVSPSCGAITVENAGHGRRTKAAAYSLVSYGPDGNGAYLKDGTRYSVPGLVNADEVVDSHFVNGADTGTYAATYVQKDYGQYAGDGDARFPFAHIVRYKERWQMQDAYDRYSPLGAPCTYGVRFDGVAANQGTGYRVAVGDINGDGFKDLVIVSNNAPNYNSYVIFGSAVGWTTPFPLSNLNGTNGFAVYSDTVRSIDSVAVGDINGDGKDDLILGISSGGPGPQNGYVYVIFGKASGWAASASIASYADGTHGFRLDGTAAMENAGRSVAAGDVNGDGKADIIIGAPNASPGGASMAGSVYVVYGGATHKDGTPWAASATADSLADGTNGFRIDGAVANPHGQFASRLTAGDVNGDRNADILFDAGNDEGGMIYVILGGATHKDGTPWAAAATTTSLADGVNGFAITDSAASYDTLVQSAVADVNGDGIGDIIVNAPARNSGATNNGSVFVLFGKAAGWTASVAPTTYCDGTKGFRIDGPPVFRYFFGGEESAWGQIAAGDVNGDGYADLIIGSSFTGTQAGTVYVVYGGPTRKDGTAWTSGVSVTALADGVNGFEFDGAAAGDLSGYAVSAGDVTGDGKAEIIIGGFQADPNGVSNAGSTYMIFGRSIRWTTPFSLNNL
jgi:prepilin-type N-terminal cleavage/methylation domain-containing protein